MPCIILILIWATNLLFIVAYNVDVFCTMKHAISKITGNELTHDQLALVKNFKTLLDSRSGYINIDGFTIDDVNNLIYTLSID